MVVAVDRKQSCHDIPAVCCLLNGDSITFLKHSGPLGISVAIGFDQITIPLVRMIKIRISDNDISAIVSLLNSFTAIIIFSTERFYP